MDNSTSPLPLARLIFDLGLEAALLDTQIEDFARRSYQALHAHWDQIQAHGDTEQHLSSIGYLTRAEGEVETIVAHCAAMAARALFAVRLEEPFRLENLVSFGIRGFGVTERPEWDG